VRAGDGVKGGAPIARLRSPDLEEELVVVRADLDRTAAERARLASELAVREGTIARAAAHLTQRELELRDMDEEQRQIQQRQRAEQRVASVFTVELTTDNAAGQLTPGMTAFTRIDIARRMLGLTLLHKTRQLLRPELWLL
jgi:multidrug efflux pump subunit AcrA (membrane-fusion protein)